ncbi:unnamed protein product [Cylindrotheca closterium]|uniref:tRNA:m(4)X modification enzyme TRM13 n=1 Tax=Cylindrotheca closterium TaxID=2856 RepID=A0AAD2FQJ3_9STRA|nr:unnamed protein product [Cylindrotheca closterium]
MSHAPSRQDGLGKNSRSKVQNITGEQVQRLIAKLDVISKFLPKVPFQEILTSQDYIIGEANVDNQGEEGGKHVLQEVSIIGHLRRINALNSETTRAIELGAGTARLSDRLQRSTNATLDHIMIDRQNFAQNHCRDRHLLARSEKKVIEQAREEKTREEKAPVIERVIVDIGSLQLDHYFDNCDDGQVGKKTLCMSKHLCGPACDLTLHALSRSVQNSGQCPPPPTAIATCCHYLCTFDSFSGREFWESTGLSEEDFVVATAVSQWASLQEKKNKSAKRRKAEKGDTTAGTKDSRNIPQQHATSLSDSEASTLPDLFSVASLAKKNLEKAMEDLEKDFIPSQEFERHFTREEKSLLGIRIKQLFDLSRAAFCQQQLGYKSAELVIYTTRSTENRLLVLH